MDPRRDGRRRFLIATGVTNGLLETADKVAASVEAKDLWPGGPVDLVLGGGLSAKSLAEMCHTW
jgi:hypothetical protein